MSARLVQKFIPKPLRPLCKKFWHIWKQKKFMTQGHKYIDFYGAQLKAPASHALDLLHAKQPFRDLCVSIIAKVSSQKYPDKALIDIGANIGDTAILMDMHSNAELVLVEGSKYFAKYLHKNSQFITNTFEIHEALIGDGNPTVESLHHWGGTAFLEKSSDSTPARTIRLSEITKSAPSFIKCDTDGHDFSIIASSFEWIKRHKPSLLIETQIRSADDVQQANVISNHLKDYGYKYLIIWNESGELMISSNSLDQFIQLVNYCLLNYKYRNETNDFEAGFFHEQDEDVYTEVIKWYDSHKNIEALNKWKELSIRSRKT